MTQFVESFATKQLLPPWEAERARTWSFAIRMSEARIRGHLKRFFNGCYGDQAPYVYEPLPGPQFGLVNICQFPNIKSVYPGQGSGSDGNPWDRLSHTEVNLAFPVYRYTVTEDRLLTARTLVWVQPVIYSNNDSIVFSSREIWGSDMFLATIEHDESLPMDSIHFDAGMIGIKTFSPRSVDQLLAILHIKATAPTRLALPGILKASPDLQEFVNILGSSGLFADGQLPLGAGKSPYPEGVELNNVKQFRDCYDMATAIYRGIVASKTSYRNIVNIVYYDPSNIEIAFMWSDSQAEFLKTLLDADKPTDTGPPSEHAGGPKPCPPDQMDWDMDRVVIKAEFGFAYTADISFSVLSTIHTYGTSA